MTNLVLILLAIGGLIVGHELTHVLVARLFRFQVPVLGLGLPVGPYLKLGSIAGTELRIHCLLVGAYATIPELDAEVPTSEASADALAKPFRRFTLWKRITVVLSGILFYVVFAWCALFFAFNSVGVLDTKPFVEQLSATNHIASDAGIQAGDQIVSIDSNTMSSPDDIVAYLRSHRRKVVAISIRRQQQLLQVSLTPNDQGKTGMLLVVKATETRKVSFIESFGQATKKVGSMTSGMFDALQYLLTNKAANSSGSHDRHGVAGLGALIMNVQPNQFPTFIALLSIDMAILSLLPWPGLDGGHLIALLIGAARGDSVSQSQKGALRWAFVIGVLLACMASLPLCMLRGAATKKK